MRIQTAAGVLTARVEDAVSQNRSRGQRGFQFDPSHPIPLILVQDMDLLVQGRDKKVFGRESGCRDDGSLGSIRPLQGIRR